MILSRFLSDRTIQRFFLVPYCAIAIGLPLNKIVLSLASMLVIALVLINFNPARYWDRLRKTKALYWLGALLLWQLSSFFWTNDHAWYLHDFTVKLPFYALPLGLSLYPVRKSSHLRLIISCFIASVSLVSIYNLVSWYGWRQFEHSDFRELSNFGSHIRFGLMVVLALIFCIYQVFTPKSFWNIPALFTGLWLLCYTFISSVFNAYLSMVIVALFAGIWFLFRSYPIRKAWLITGSSFLVVVILSVTAYQLFLKPPPPLNAANLPQYTKEGNAYLHHPNSRYYVNGHHMYSYICEKELHREWHRRTGHGLFDQDPEGKLFLYKLLHYMSQRGLTKDAEGMTQISDDQIDMILSPGMKWVEESDKPLFSRLADLRNEFYDDNPNGKTFAQRREYFRTGWHIFKANPLIGVGAGDTRIAFENQYQKDDSQLIPEYRLRAHNQFLTHLLSLGIPGFVFLLGFLISLLLRFLKRNDWPASLFIVLLAFSFLSEDTLETQMGVTFFGFFTGLFIYSDFSFIHSRKHEN